MKISDKQNSTIEKFIENFSNETHGTVVYLSVSGSKLYGTDDEYSDLDIKGIFVPSKQSILLKKDLDHYVNNNSDVKNTSDDIDITLHSVHTFLNNLAKSETGAIDILFSMFNEDNIIYENPIFTKLLKDNYKHLLNRNMKSFIGYSLGQAKKFGIKGARYDELDKFVKYLKNLNNTSDDKLQSIFENLVFYIHQNKCKYIKFINMKNRTGVNTSYISILGKLFEGTVTITYFKERVNNLYKQFGNRTKEVAETTSKSDFKALYHAARVAIGVKELLQTQFIKLPLEQKDYLTQIKKGEISEEEIIEFIHDVLAEVDILLEESTLPDETDETYLDLLKLRLIDEFAL